MSKNLTIKITNKNQHFYFVVFIARPIHFFQGDNGRQHPRKPATRVVKLGIICQHIVRADSLSTWYTLQNRKLLLQVQNRQNKTQDEFDWLCLWNHYTLHWEEHQRFRRHVCKFSLWSQLSSLPGWTWSSPTSTTMEKDYVHSPTLNCQVA